MMNLLHYNEMPFIIAGEISKVPSESGVYFCFDLGNKLLYIGKSSNLKERLRYHKNQKKYISKFHYLVTPNINPIDLSELEDKYIFCFRPIFNQEFNPGLSNIACAYGKENANRVLFKKEKGIYSFWECYKVFPSVKQAKEMMNQLNKSDPLFEYKLGESIN